MCVDKIHAPAINPARTYYEVPMILTGSWLEGNTIFLRGLSVLLFGLAAFLYYSRVFGQPHQSPRDQSMSRKFSLARLWCSRKDSLTDDSMSNQVGPGSIQDCFRTALLLRRLPLPPDIIPDILDYAGVYADVTAVENERPCMVSQRNSGMVHTVTPIPPHIHRSSVRSVIFTTRSHDQGWSWEKKCHGTYEGSWTWFEAGILMKTAEPTLGDCKQIITNVHASKNEKTHRVEWFADDEDPYIQLIFRKLRQGESIGLNVCACFPGWQNLARYSSIGFTYRPVRKVP